MPTQAIFASSISHHHCLLLINSITAGVSISRCTCATHAAILRGRPPRASFVPRGAVPHLSDCRCYSNARRARGRRVLPVRGAAGASAHGRTAPVCPETKTRSRVARATSAALRGRAASRRHRACWRCLRRAHCRCAGSSYERASGAHI